MARRMISMLSLVFAVLAALGTAKVRVILPEGQYKVRLSARDAASGRVERERTLYLACDTTVDFDL